MSAAGVDDPLAREEADLVAQVAAGDIDAPMAELYRRYAGRLYRFGMQALGDAGLAEEMVQECFVRLWRTAGRFDPARGSVAAYIIVIGRSVAADVRKRPSSRPLEQLEETQLPPQLDSVDEILSALIVREALDSLSQAHQQVLMLAEAGLTQSQIATQLGLPLGTVKTRIFHGLRALRSTLDKRVADLVARARNGDKRAWDALVERYAPLIWSICRRHQLGATDAADISQSVWLRLVDQLDMIREPAALPGWLATTTRREALRVVRTARGSQPVAYELDVENLPDELARAADQEVLEAERHAALRQAFGALDPFSRQLVSLLIQDPPVPYAEISARLGIAVGSIGPSRGRCLEKLRRHPAIAALINAECQDLPDIRRCA